jgi:hypothetical protein
MNKLRLESFIGGWLVGDFEPTLFENCHVEVGVKFFVSGNTELEHAQIKATEITIIHRGRVRIGQTTLEAGDVLVVHPGEFADFEALSDGSLTCIKFPSIPSDKILK